MAARVSLLLFALPLYGCLSSTQESKLTPKDEVLPPERAEPTDNGGIPWAPGEGPGAPREVGEQPRSYQASMSDEAFESTEGDGVVQAGRTPGCTGRVSLPLRAEVQARISSLKTCNERAPEGFVGRGVLKYTLRIETDGTVKTLYKLEDAPELGEVTACVEAQLKKPFDEKPMSGCAQFVVPYELVVEEGQENSPEVEESRGEMNEGEKPGTDL